MPEDAKKKGPGLGLVIGVGPAKEADDGAKEMAAQELMDAKDDGDPKAFARAFQHMVDMCSSGEDYDDEEMG